MGACEGREAPEYEERDEHLWSDSPDPKSSEAHSPVKSNRPLPRKAKETEVAPPYESRESDEPPKQTSPHDSAAVGIASFVVAHDIIDPLSSPPQAESITQLEAGTVACSSLGSDTLSSLPSADVSASEIAESQSPSEIGSALDAPLDSLSIIIPSTIPSTSAPPRSLTDTTVGSSLIASYPSSAPVADEFCDISSDDDDELPSLLLARQHPHQPSGHQSLQPSPFLTPTVARSSSLRDAVLGPSPADPLSPCVFEGSPAFLPAPLQVPSDGQIDGNGGGSEDSDTSLETSNLFSGLVNESPLAPGMLQTPSRSNEPQVDSVDLSLHHRADASSCESATPVAEAGPFATDTKIGGSSHLNSEDSFPAPAEQPPPEELCATSGDEQPRASSPSSFFFTPVPLHAMSPTARTTSVAAEAAALAMFSHDHMSVAPTPTPMAARLAQRDEISQRRAGKVAQIEASSPAGPVARKKIRRGGGKKGLKSPASPPMSPATFYAPSPAAGATAALAHYAKLSFSCPPGAAPDSPFVLPVPPSNLSVAVSFTAGGATLPATALREPARSEALRVGRDLTDAGSPEQKESSAMSSTEPVHSLRESSAVDMSLSKARQQASEADSAGSRNANEVEVRKFETTKSGVAVKAAVHLSGGSLLDASAPTLTTTNMRATSHLRDCQSPVVPGPPESTPGNPAQPTPAHKRSSFPVTDYLESDSFPRAATNDTKTKNRWAEGDFTRVILRGKTYMDDKVKIQASVPVFQTLGLVITKASQGIRHCAARLPKLRAFLDEQSDNFPFFMLFTWILPGDEPLTVIQVCGRTNARGADPEFDALLDTYIASDDAYRSDRIKFLCSMETAPWVVTFSLNNLAGNKPALIGNKLECHHYTGPNYCEIDIDVGSSKIASALNGIIYSNAKSLALHMGFMIEGRCSKELPERLLAIAKFIHVAPKVVCRDLTGDEIGPLGTDTEEASRSDKNRAAYASRFGITPAVISRK